MLKHILLLAGLFAAVAVDVQGKEGELTGRREGGNPPSGPSWETVRTGLSRGQGVGGGSLVSPQSQGQCGSSGDMGQVYIAVLQEECD